MKWEKKGLIFNPQGKLGWATQSALQPTPILIDENRIRIYCGLRDEHGVSRVGWVDVDSSNPSIVLNYSKLPALDIGLPGAFDDNGVVPAAIVKRAEGLFLYYAGYQLVKNVRFLVLGGLAISHNGGNSFTRTSNTPILERTNEEFLFRVIHSIIFENGVWKVWYGGGNHFIQGESKTFPVYDIRYMESPDGIHFPQNGKVVLGNGVGEYRVARPYVIKRNNKYLMFFGASTPTTYRLTYAESEDGYNWIRKDASLQLEYKAEDFDSQMSAYPGIVQVKDRMYMFYNGNDYGKEGFGYAQLIDG